LNDVDSELRALLLLALAGDNGAYGEFLTRAGARVRAYGRRRLAAYPDDVEDLVQETLLAMHNQRHTYRPSQPLTPWLHAIARYKLIDLLRVRMPRTAAEVELDDESADEAMHASDGAAAEARRDLAQLLSALPDRFRLPIVHVKIEGLSVAEASARLGMSESAVKVGIHRGMKALATQAARSR
jgi:RNA polymerase sigma-70 factor (ECF subfamily)